MKTKIVYVSGGEFFAPAEIKSALDDIRKTLDLPDDVVLFGLPVDDFAAPPAPEPVAEPKVLRLPQRPKKSILNVITAEPQAPAALSDEPLVVSDEDGGTFDSAGSITDLLGKLPSLTEEDAPAAAPAGRGLADEFSDFLDAEDAKSPPAKKARPFARKKGAAMNILGDLFSYAGMAANDDSRGFQLPDFIKRP